MTVVPKEDKLNDREKAFVDNYTGYGTATHAASIAGYSHPDKMGSRLLQRPKIQRAIAAKQQTAEDTADVMTHEEYLKILSEQARNAMHPAVRYKYMELLGKAMGWLVPRPPDSSTPMLLQIISDPVDRGPRNVADWVKDGKTVVVVEGSSESVASDYKGDGGHPAGNVPRLGHTDTNPPQIRG